ncbi:MAG TPA: hypothetical protein VKT51_07230 [Candidatus Eremiobacteraceae bacterium]|nr:hypothetical protein [Candidatus Eremiobacteraceae bacterium]
MNRHLVKRGVPACLLIATCCVLSACNGTAPHAAAAPPIPNTTRAMAFGPRPDHSGRLGVVLTSQDGGQIFGFDIGQDNGAGILSTANHVEAFDQQTGAITQSFPKVTPARTTYALDGIFPSDIALVTRYVEPKGSIFANRYYDVVSPFTAGGFTGKWTPPIFDIDIQQGAKVLNSTTSVLFAIQLKSNDRPVLVATDIGANSIAKVVHLSPNTFGGGDGPQLASYTFQGKAVFALSPDGGAVGGAAPINILVDYTTGAAKQFTGFNFGPFGAGYVNGMAVDPNTGIEATTTELNAQVEFYNLVTRAGIAAVQLPCTGNADQSNSGAGIAVDPVHRLFLVTDPAYACDGSRDGAIVVYNEKGTLVETIPGFKFAIAEPAPALDPAKRLGWDFGPQFSQLQQFFY